jgi:PAS domain S-box-containing protein
MELYKLKHSELTFQLIVESTPNAIVLVNKEGKIAYVNNKTELLFGYTRLELIGQLVELLIPQRFRENHPAFRGMFTESPMVRAMGAGRELFALRKDGTEFPIEIGLNPLVTVDGTLVLASIIDITERKKAEERFRLVVESSPNAMVLINDKGIISLVNSEAERLFGYERNELIGNRLDMLIPEHFRAIHANHQDKFFQKPQARNILAMNNLFAVKKDKTEIPVEVGLNPIETNGLNMVLASIIDITARKRHEEIIKKQVNELEIKNKALEQFTFIASHDLQEPLRTVSNYIQLFEEDYSAQLDENALKYLHAINKATNRMNSLIKGLLEFSRLGTNQVLVPVDSRKIVDDVLADLDTLITSTGAQITVGPMPRLDGYELDLRQLFQNLLVNAIKFQKKGQKPVIEIAAEKMNEKWKFSVKDNGIGIAEEHFEKMFHIFQRLDTKAGYDGNGIGLANCRKIAELHNGKIWVESRVGQGSTFYFTI